MSNEPKTAPQAPASDAANQSAKSATTETKPIVTPTPAPAATPPSDAKKV